VTLSSLCVLKSAERLLSHYVYCKAAKRPNEIGDVVDDTKLRHGSMLLERG
jgi:hypothetical protein